MNNIYRSDVVNFVVQRLRQVGFDVINDRLGWVTAARITLQILLVERAMHSQSDEAAEPMRRSTVCGSLPWEGEDRKYAQLACSSQSGESRHHAQRGVDKTCAPTRQRPL